MTEFDNKKLEKLRKDEGASMDDIGETLATPRPKQTIWKWETGATEPGFSSACELADRFKVPLDYFRIDRKKKPEKIQQVSKKSPVNSKSWLEEV